MSTSEFNYHLPSDSRRTAIREEHIEIGFIGKLQNLKYEYRPDIRDRAALEANFREKFEALNRVKLTCYPSIPNLGVGADLLDTPWRTHTVLFSRARWPVLFYVMNNTLVRLTRSTI